MEDLYISVIIPIYNRGYCLPRCLDSVESQTWQAWECWLIDDGSTDDSLAICEQYAARDKRFKVYHQPNGGVSAARNRGLERAEGKQIAFIDSDDWIDPNYLHLLLQALDGCEMSLCGMTLTDPQGNPFGQHSEPSGVYRMDDSNTGFLVRTIDNGLVLSPACKLFKKERIDRLGLRYEEHLHWGEDAVFACSYLSEVEQVGVVSNPLYHVMKQEHSLSAGARYETDCFRSGLLAWQGIADFFAKRNIQTEEARAFVGRYYCLTIKNGIGLTPYFHTKLSLFERYRYIREILRNMNQQQMNQYMQQLVSNRMIAWMFCNKQALLLWLCYELKYLKNKLTLK